MRFWTVFPFFLALFTRLSARCPPKNSETLVLAHVLFRHGNRTADSKAELYPKDPYYEKTYFPIGLGQLTNAGKNREYHVGKELRERYNDFLGDLVYPQLVDARTSDYNRTKASLLYVLAGLFPPKEEQIWNDLEWQAVPYNFWPRDKDPVLMGVKCPNYLRLYDINRYSDQQQAEFTPYKETFEYISENSGLNVTSFEEIYDLYFGLSTEAEFGLKLPEWLDSLWPEKIIFFANKEYYVSVATTQLKQIAAGYLIEKIVQDTQSKILEDPTTEFKKKLYLYSAHENNIAQLMITLDIFDDKIPNYGSYIILEVHLIDNVYGIKIYYQNYYDSNGPKLLKLPACEEFCPLEKFIELYQEYYPKPNLCWEN